MLRARLTLVVLTSVFAFPASGQDHPETDRSGNPIVVRGELEPATEDLPVRETEAAGERVVSRQISSEAERFLRCAGLPDAVSLQTILDGAPAAGATQAALHKFVVTNSGCFGIRNTSLRGSPYYGRCNPHIIQLRVNVCRVTFDRGVLFERAVAEYGGEVPLRRQETFDPEIRARFMARETRRNQARREDSDYFDIVACMVQISPEYALALLREPPGSAEEMEARKILIGQGAPCVGYAQRVQVEAAQFRAYTAEAVYSWKVAVMGADSLMPLTPG